MNVNNPQERTVSEIARPVIELSGSESELVHEPLPEDNPKRRRPDLTRAKDIVGLGPKVSPKEGLRRRLERFAGRSERVCEVS